MTGRYGRGALVITGANPNASPTQGALLARKFIDEGVPTTLHGRGDSSAKRALDVIVNGAVAATHHDSVLVNVFCGRAFLYEAAAIAYSKLMGKRTVAVLRGGSMPEFMQRWPRLIPRVLNFADAVVVPHEYLREQLAPFSLRVDAMVPNIIELENYPFRERSRIAPRLLFLRSFHPIYNPQLAVRVLAELQKTHPDASLTMAGPEDIESEPTRALVQTLGVRNVTFAGLVSKPKLVELAGEHDIHINTNRIDNFPVSVVEMWACGLPVVATRVGGTAYLIRDGEDGLLTPSDDALAMAQECRRLLGDAELTRRLSLAGRVRAESLTWDRVKGQWFSLLFPNVETLTPPKGG